MRNRDESAVGPAKLEEMSDRATIEEFRLRSVAIAAFAPATLFGLAEGAMLPVIVASSLDRGASTAMAAFIVALLGIGSLVTNIPSGILATRIGERRAMLVAAAVTIAGLLLCIVNLGSGAWSLALYGLGVLLVGGASSVYNLARQSYLTEMVPPHMRARALSTLGGTMRIGIFVGPFLGAGATALWGLSGAYFVALAAIVAAGVIVHGVPDLELGEGHRRAAAQVTTMSVIRDRWRMFLTLGTGVLLLTAIRQARQSVIPLWVSHIGLSATDASIIYGIAGAVDALTFYPAGKVMDVHGRRAVAVPSVLIMAVSCMLMPLTHGFLTVSARRGADGIRQRHRLGHRYDARGGCVTVGRAADVPGRLARTLRCGGESRSRRSVGGRWDGRSGRRHPCQRRDRLCGGSGALGMDSATSAPRERGRARRHGRHPRIARRLRSTMSTSHH